MVEREEDEGGEREEEKEEEREEASLWGGCHLGNFLVGLG